MTEEELKLLERRCDEATSGPWEIEDEDPRRLTVYGRTNVMDYPVVSTIVKCAHTTQTDPDGRVWECAGSGIQNAEFIAAARDYLPMLIAEVRRLKEAVEAGKRAAFEAGYGQGYEDAERCDDREPLAAWDHWERRES